ncbi:MAG TPA: site-specific integrase, partial [Solirubrobacteraceae bacterium]|nr:site-specific integrase [Solirubrobacteraceae bacterium]
RPLPPLTIERMRAASTPRDATLISVLAYAGLRPGEALALQWRDIREHSATGTVWSQPAYQSWRRRAFKRSLDGAGVEHARPYDLRHSYASLLFHEGRSVIYVARQLGHDARLTLSTYGHVMDEFEDASQLDATTAIADARAALANEEPKLRRQ